MHQRVATQPNRIVRLPVAVFRVHRVRQLPRHPGRLPRALPAHLDQSVRDQSGGGRLSGRPRRHALLGHVRGV